jgi:hypothetical protein
MGNVLVAGRPYGWHYTDPDREFAAVEINWVSRVSHTVATNQGTLGVHLPISQGSGAPLIFGVDTCPSGLNLGGKTITAWVMRSVAVGPPPQDFPPDASQSSCGFVIGDPLSGTSVGSTVVPAAANVWTRVTGTIPILPVAAGLTDINMACSTPLTPWDGTLYVDDVSISP